MIMIMIIIIIYLTANGLSPGGSRYYACTYILNKDNTNKKKGYKKFKSGGLHEKHAVAIWSLGNHLSICL